MHFLANSMYLPEDFGRPREADRSLAHWAATRERSAQIYDREVIALVQGDESAERLRNESSGKVNVQNVNGWKADATILRDVLIKHFGRTIPKAGNLPAPKAAQRAPMQGNTLITCVGTNIMSTLLAITSHKPAHVVLCYTERVPAVAEYAQRLQKLAPELGMTASLVPISIEGLFLDALLPVPEERAQILVNISPGTKGQGAMLSLWAERHNAAVWSINRAAQQIDPLYAPHGETAQPLFMSDPALYLQVCGERLHDAGAYMDALAPDLPLMDGLLAFMRAALDEGKDAAVLRKSVRAGGMELCPAGGKNSKQWELRREGNVFPFTFAGGEWFEKLAAVAFSRARAHVVRQKVRLDWCETTREAIIQRHTYTKEEEVFRVDMDVVGAWGPDIFLVSCKSNPYTALELQRNAGTICLPMRPEASKRFLRAFSEEALERFPGLPLFGASAPFTWSNGLGRQFTAAIKTAGKLPPLEGIRHLCKLSRLVETANREAFRAGLEQVLRCELQRKDRSADKITVPLRPLVLGGDDITVIVRADLALPFIHHFIFFWSGRSTTSDSNRSGHLCVSPGELEPVVRAALLNCPSPKREGFVRDLTCRRMQTALNDDRQVKGQTLRTLECGIPGTLFTATLQVNAPDMDSAWTRAYFQAVCAAVKSMGGNRSRGFGACRITFGKPEKQPETIGLPPLCPAWARCA